MARKVIEIIYSFVRRKDKHLKVLLARLAESDQIEQGMQEVFRTLRSTVLILSSAEEIVKN